MTLFHRIYSITTVCSLCVPILSGYLIFVTIVTRVSVLYDGLTVKENLLFAGPAAHLSSLILVSLTLNKENLWLFAISCG